MIILSYYAEQQLPYMYITSVNSLIAVILCYVAGLSNRGIRILSLQRQSTCHCSTLTVNICNVIVSLFIGKSTSKVKPETDLGNNAAMKFKHWANLFYR